MSCTSTDASVGDTLINCGGGVSWGPIYSCGHHEDAGLVCNTRKETRLFEHFKIGRGFSHIVVIDTLAKRSWSYFPIEERAS